MQEIESQDFRSPEVCISPHIINYSKIKDAEERMFFYDLPLEFRVTQQYTCIGSKLFW